MEQKDECFLHGFCDELAVSVSDVIKCDIIAAICFDEQINCTVLVHCWVRYQGKTFDASGYVDIHKSLKNYPEGDNSEIVILTREDIAEITGNTYKEDHSVFRDKLLGNLGINKG